MLHISSGQEGAITAGVGRQMIVNLAESLLTHRVATCHTHTADRATGFPVNDARLALLQLARC